VGVKYKLPTPSFLVLAEDYQNRRLVKRRLHIYVNYFLSLGGLGKKQNNMTGGEIKEPGQIPCMEKGRGKKKAHSLSETTVKCYADANKGEQKKKKEGAKLRLEFQHPVLNSPRWGAGWEISWH